MLRRRIFTEDHDVFRASLQKWADAEVAPHEAQWRRDGQVSRDVWKSAGAQGYLGMFMPEEFGGLGLTDYRYDQILIEELTWRSPGFFVPLHNRIVAPYFLHVANDAQKARFLPGIISGETILAIGMTEPSTGSDLGAIRTKAEDKGDHWLLNGSKIFISNGLLADVVVVAARTDPDNPRAIGLFAVERGMEGFSRGQKLEKLGLPSQDTAELFFDNVKIPKENQLGGAANGFANMMRGLAEERLTGAIGFQARAERAFAVTMDYIQDRKAFGRPVGTFQNSRFVMAGLRTKLDAAQAFVDHCVSEHLEEALSAELAAEVKLLTSEVEWEVVDACLQLHGGNGYMQEYEICRLFADARISRIYAGTSEIMKEIIGRGLGLDERR